MVSTGSGGRDFLADLQQAETKWLGSAFLGGVITALLFAGGRYLIGLYLAEAAPGSAYGSMGALVLMLVWIYYASVVFFAGALITAVIDERRVREVSRDE